MPRNRVRIGIEKTLISRAPSARAGRACRWRSSGIASSTHELPRRPGARVLVADPVARLVEVERRRRRTRPPGCPTPRRGRRAPRPPSTAGCSRSRAATAGAGTLTPPLTTTSSTRPSTCSRPSSSSRPASEVQEPAVDQHLGGQLRVAVVPVEERRPGDPDPAVGVDRDRHPVQRRSRRRRSRRRSRPSRTSPPPARPPPRPRARAAPGRSGRRRAAPCAKLRSASASAVVEQPVQLGRHQRDERRRRRARLARTTRGPRAAPARARRPATGRPPARPRRTTAAAPAASGRPAEPALGRRDRGQHRARGRAAPASARRSSPDVSTTSGSASRPSSQPRRSTTTSPYRPERRLLTVVTRPER